MTTRTSISELEDEANKTPPQQLIAYLLVLAGVACIIATVVLWAVLADKAGNYYAYDKAVRDSAGAGSEVLSDQSTLEAYPGWLSPMPFVGIAFFVIGIAVLFGSIMAKLKLRASVLSTVLPSLRDRRAS